MMQPKPVGSTIENGAQVQQQFNMECVTDFSDIPVMSIQFL